MRALAGDDRVGHMHAAIGAIDDRLMAGYLGQRPSPAGIEALQLALRGEDRRRLGPHAEFEADRLQIEPLGQRREAAIGRENLYLSQAIGLTQIDGHRDLPGLPALVDIVFELRIIITRRARRRFEPAEIGGGAALKGELAIDLALPGD